MDIVLSDPKNRELAYFVLVNDQYDYPVQQGWNHLTYAALRGHMSVVDALIIDFEWHPDKSDINGLTALHAATLGKQFAIVERLLYLGADPTIVTRESLTPALIAESLGLERIAHRLRQASATICEK